jgi:hypothetical protein
LRWPAIASKESSIGIRAMKLIGDFGLWIIGVDGNPNHNPDK